MPPMGSVEAKWLEKQQNRITRGTMPIGRAYQLRVVAAGGGYGEWLMEGWGRWPPARGRLPPFGPSFGT